MSNVHDNKPMTPSTFKRRMKTIREQFPENGRASFDQEVCACYYESGMKLREIADLEGVSKTKVGNRCRFGRFLSSFSEVKVLENLTELTFRKLWPGIKGHSDGEPGRFKEIVNQLQENPELVKVKPRLGGGDSIASEFGDGKWHTRSDMEDNLGLDRKALMARLKTITKNQHKGSHMIEYREYRIKPGPKRTCVDREYRIVRATGEEVINREVLLNELTPVIDELLAAGRIHRAHQSPAYIIDIANKLRNRLDIICEGIGSK